MTCILGVVTDTGVFLGADHQVTFGTEYADLLIPKVWEAGPLIIGASGSARFGQIVKYHVHVEPPQWGMNIVAWLVTTYVPAVSAAVDQYGGKEEDGLFNGDILIAVYGHLYRIDRAGAVYWIDRDYEAIGSGASYAIGALAGLQRVGVAMFDRSHIELALAVACSFDAHCRPPFTVYERQAERP